MYMQPKLRCVSGESQRMMTLSVYVALLECSSC